MKHVAADKKLEADEYLYSLYKLYREQNYLEPTVSIKKAPYTVKSML